MGLGLWLGGKQTGATAARRTSSAAANTASQPIPANGDVPVRVLIADDHKLVCMGMRMLLENAGFEVVGEASTGRQAVQLGKETEPDVILLDIIMPDMDGLHALSALRAALPQTSVIMSTAYARPDFLARAIALGAAGYITKDDEPASIPRAVRAVVEGDAIVNREMLTLALRELSTLSRTTPVAPDKEATALTPQQLRVLSLIAEGMDNATIADTLSLSKNTIKTHVREIFSRLGVTDRTQAAIWALRNGLVR
jgi:DNA-binding NarL/FixJ family response regulator